MLQARQYLAFGFEPLEHGVRIHAPFDQLDRHPLIELPIGAVREVNHAHAAAPEFSSNYVGTNPAAGACVARRELRDRIVRGVESQQPVHVLQQNGVGAAGLLDECGAFGRSQV